MASTCPQKWQYNWKIKTREINNRLSLYKVMYYMLFPFILYISSKTTSLQIFQILNSTQGVQWLHTGSAVRWFHLWSRLYCVSETQRECRHLFDSCLPEVAQNNCLNPTFVPLCCYGSGSK